MDEKIAMTKTEQVDEEMTKRQKFKTWVKKTSKKVTPWLVKNGPIIGVALVGASVGTGIVNAKSNHNQKPKKDKWTEEEARDLTCAAAKALSGLGYIGPDRGVVITTDPLGNYMTEPVTRRKE